MSKIIIIAEVGVNHNGDANLAKLLIDEARAAGANAVKFQTFQSKLLATSSVRKSDYQHRDGPDNTSQLEMLKKYELSKEEHYALRDYCRNKKIDFLTSGFDLESLELIEDLDLGVYKIPSGEITNLPYLKVIGAKSKKIWLSTGMSNIDEISTAIDVLTYAGANREDITLLQCTSAYYTPYEDVNLLAMNNLNKYFGLEIGLSDHSIGVEVPIAAAALGATVIEKHLTLDRDMLGPDHFMSIEPSEFKAMVQSIRNIELALGDGIKRVMPSEIENRLTGRKYLVAAKRISRGSIIETDDITVKRSGGGVSPMMIGHLIGSIANKDYEIDDIFDSELIGNQRS